MFKTVQSRVYLGIVLAVIAVYSGFVAFAWTLAKHPCTDKGCRLPTHASYFDFWLTGAAWIGSIGGSIALVVGAVCLFLWWIGEAPGTAEDQLKEALRRKAFDAKN